jgi:2'-5' RNA ligase
MTDPRAWRWEAWQLPYRHGTLAIWPPQVVRDYVNRFRQKLDPISDGYAEAHITLTQPFRAPVTEHVIDHVRSILAAEKPFSIAYGPLRSFFPAPVLWLDVHPRERALKLRHELHATGLFDLSLPHTDDFVPHMTLTEGLSGTPVNDALFRELAPSVEGGTFTCDGIAFIRPNARFRFEVEREIAFGDD